jgi:hypothetical protein
MCPPAVHGWAHHPAREGGTHIVLSSADALWHRMQQHICVPTGTAQAPTPVKERKHASSQQARETGRQWQQPFCAVRNLVGWDIRLLWPCSLLPLVAVLVCCFHGLACAWAACEGEREALQLITSGNQ